MVIGKQQQGQKEQFCFVTFDDYDSVDKTVIQKSHAVNGPNCELRRALSQQMMVSASFQEAEVVLETVEVVLMGMTTLVVEDTSVGKVALVVVEVVVDTVAVGDGCDRFGNESSSFRGGGSYNDSGSYNNQSSNSGDRSSGPHGGGGQYFVKPQNQGDYGGFSSSSSYSSGRRF